MCTRISLRDLLSERGLGNNFINQAMYGTPSDVTQRGPTVKDGCAAQPCRNLLDSRADGQTWIPPEDAVAELAEFTRNLKALRSQAEDEGCNSS